LDLRENRLTRLPKHFGVMVAISELFLDKNEIRELPKSMRTMKNIVSLHVNHNVLYNWPWCLEYLTTLTELHLNHNQIEGRVPALPRFALYLSFRFMCLRCREALPASVYGVGRHCLLLCMV
jgi:Leucine-rich repeat (LRR) protein